MTTPGLPPGAIAFLNLGIQGTAAGMIADLQSLAGDVEYARWCAQAYLAAMGPNERQDPEANNFCRALWTSCCITYRRVFVDGKGHISPQKPRPRPNATFTAALTPNQLAAHNLVLETANRHVAHRVNELERVTVFLTLNPPPLPRAVVGTNSMLMHYTGPTDPAIVQQFVSVCDLLYGSTNQEYDRLIAETTAEFQQRDDLDEMYAAARNPGEQSST